MLPLIPYNKSDGPFTNGDGYTVYFRVVNGYRQKRPYNIPSPYRLEVFKVLSGSGTSATSWSEGPSSYGAVFDTAYTTCTNRAYKTWFAQTSSEAAQFGATLTAERAKTWSMFVSVVTRVLSAARSVKRLHFFEAARTLGIPYKEVKKRKLVGWVWKYAVRKKPKNFDSTVYRPKEFKFKLQTRRGKRGIMVRVPVYQKKTYMEFGQRREVLKSLAGGWLLWSYGVKPLAEDCHSAMVTLTSDYKPKTVRSKVCKAKASYAPHSDQWGNRLVRSLDVGVVVRSDIKVINYDTFLLNKMGLTNPVQWILEAIPFSFVVDWFSNLSEVVNSMNELGGLSVTNPSTSGRHKQTETRIYVHPPSAVLNNYSKERFSQIRSPGVIKPPVLQFAYERFEWQRGLNAISLLVGFLPRKTR